MTPTARRSLRRTLAVRFGLTMALALTVIALLAFLGVRRTLVAQLDRSLRATAQLQSYTYVQLGSIVELSDYSPDMERFVEDVNRFVVIRDTNGRALEANTDVARRLPLDTAALATALAEGQAVATARADQYTVRSLYRRIERGRDGAPAVIQVGASLEPLFDAAQNDLFLMLATAGLGALAALIGSWWLARSALAPVDAVTAQAQRIQGDASGQQITAHADVAELQGLIAVLNDMIARLERSREWHRRIIRDLGHDLRTPLAAMQACVDVSLRGDRSSDVYRAALRSNLEEIDRLTLISDALILVGRLENDELDPVRTRTDLASLADAAVARARGRGRASLRVDRDQAEVWADVDRTLLATALDQLIDNAIRHGLSATRIEVSAHGTNGRVQLMVEDDGPGVPNALLPYLFERFFRADEARGRGAGPGLGLTAVAAIAELHHGTVTADRGPLGGLRVRIDLPALQEPEISGAPASPR